MMSIGHGAVGAPTGLVGGAALGNVKVPNSQHKLDQLADKMKTKKSEDLKKPYVSEAQRRWAHTPKGKEALGGEAAVHHWDEATRGKKLPETKKAEDAEKKPLPTDEKEPLDWDTLIGERLNHFSQLLRSEIVRLKLKKIQDYIK